MSTKKSEKSLAQLEKISGKKLSMSSFLWAIREGEEMTQVAFASLLGISRQYLCDIERGRRSISARMAANFAKKLGYSEKQFIRLALQDDLKRQGFHFSVELKEAA
jgi:transcriptional regulator with XRE-family HTH domain